MILNTWVSFWWIKYYFWRHFDYRANHVCYLDALDSEYLESTQNSGNCFGYATLTEEATGATVRVCGGRERKRHIYISTTNRIQIHIDEQNENEGDILYFVMEYAGDIHKTISILVIC